MSQEQSPVSEDEIEHIDILVTQPYTVDNPPLVKDSDLQAIIEEIWPDIVDSMNYLRDK